MDVDEIEGLITEEKNKLGKLEEAYEKEEDEKKCVKLEYKISRKEEQIDKLIDRQQTIFDKDALNDENEEEEEEEDFDVCSECGADLIFLEKSDEGDIFICEKCGELYLDQ